ncbi:hypothetical protein BUALT_Bualt07G0040400 [Buddleja alternifolia]|uniref:NB-ARC domain-containing protein n=1 Tax=Buddleja alternifolia TaxID=168488 RepID=A0AAV6XEQ5_9LAMI|nr:hypothetical protein BUALT_Bualt07G0040400 [Buddleja alternifolia]
MAVSAYASVVSLMHVLDQIQHPSRHRLLPNMKQIETLREKVHFLQEFLELHSATKVEGMEDLIKQITAVADEAEDIIDSHVVDQLREEHEERIYMGIPLLFHEDTSDDHVVDQLHGGSQSTIDIGLSSFCQAIDKVIGKIDSIKKELLTMVNEGMAVQEQAQPSVSQPAAAPSTLPSHGKNTVVGFDEHLEYSVHEILRGILIDIGVTDDIKGETLAELGQRLHKKLFRRRYLIVMDDLWSTKGWDDFKLSFPDSGNRSRVMITTRLSDVAISLGSHRPYFLDFLDENNSWNLLCEKAFTQRSSSPELEEIGKRIAKSCEGLPLSISVIGGLLAKSNMT